MKRRRHINTFYLDNISWGTLSCHWSFSNYLNLSWDMTDWNLISWFLDFNHLVTDKFTLLNLENKLPLNLVFYASLTWTLNSWSELFWAYNLVYFKSACITGINSYWHTWFDITAPCNNTFDWNHSANLISFNFAHFYKILFDLLSRSNHQMILSLKLWRNI